MNTDLFGHPIPPAPITGAQGYLLDTRRTDAPIVESGKLAALRAASAKDAPVLLGQSDFVLWGHKPGHGGQWLKLEIGTYGECATANTTRTRENWTTCIRRKGESPALS